MSRLTSKEEAFAPASGRRRDRLDAYRARDCTTMKPSTIAVERQAVRARGHRQGPHRGAEGEVQKKGTFAAVSRARARARSGSPQGVVGSSEAGGAQPTPDEPPSPRRPPRSPSSAAGPPSTPRISRRSCSTALPPGSRFARSAATTGCPTSRTVRAWAVDPNHPFAARYARPRKWGSSRWRTSCSRSPTTAATT